MTRSEVIFEQRLRLVLAIVYLGLTVANYVLKQKENKTHVSAADSSAAEALTPA